MEPQGLIPQLQERFTQPLPGLQAHEEMARTFRKLSPTPPPNALEAATLALLYPKAQQWHMVFIKRVSNNRHDRHSGQISFPGGRAEEEDRGYNQTALREAQEEVGVDPSSITLIGQLTQLYIPVSNFLVYPFVGYTEQPPNFQAQVSEVQHIIEVPIPLLLSPESRQTTRIRLSEQIQLPNVPCFIVNDHIIWGATAMMLNEFLRLIQA